MAITNRVFDVNQDNSGKYVAKLVDENGDALSYEVLDTLQLTLYDSKTEDIINSRDEQNVLNTNDVTLDCEGNLVWVWTPEDMPKILTKPDPEVHIALWRAVWNSGESQILHEVKFRVHGINVPD